MPFPLLVNKLSFAERRKAIFIFPDVRNYLVPGKLIDWHVAGEQISLRLPHNEFTWSNSESAESREMIFWSSYQTTKHFDKGACITSTVTCYWPFFKRERYLLWAASHSRRSMPGGNLVNFSTIWKNKNEFLELLLELTWSSMESQTQSSKDWDFLKVLWAMEALTTPLLVLVTLSSFRFRLKTSFDLVFPSQEHKTPFLVIISPPKSPDWRKASSNHFPYLLSFLLMKPQPSNSCLHSFKAARIESKRPWDRSVTITSAVILPR